MRDGLIFLDFHPSKIIEGDHFFISRKSDIKKYLAEISFNNPKHLKRMREIAPSSSGQG